MKKILSIGLILILALCYSCKEDDETIIEVNKVEITPATLSMVEGISEQLSVKILPEDATDKSITWTSSDETILSVSDEGLVTAVKEGKCNVLAISDNDIKGICEVSVSKIKVTLNSTEAELVVGKTKQLIATFTPADASNKDIKWTSSNDEVASVSETGLITAIKIGKVDVVATLSNGEKATCKVDVINSYVEVTSISLNKGAKFITKTDFVKFTAEVLPANASDKTIVWSTSDPEVGYLTKSGAWLGSKKGTTIITATASNGVSASCELTFDCTPVTGVTTLNEMTINLDEEVPFEYTVLPENASNSWLLSNEKGGIVIGGDEEGLLFSTDLKKISIMGVKVGDYTITVKTEDGEFTSTTKVKVIDPSAPVGTFEFTLKNASMAHGDQKLLIEMKVEPKSLFGEGITWTSSDETVATVVTHLSEDRTTVYALITEAKAGSCVLTATLANGMTATCDFTVRDITYVTSITLSQESYTIKVGETVDLGITILPENATDKTVSFSTWDKDFVSFSDGKITGLKKGNTYISISAKDGSLVSKSMVRLIIE